MNLSDFEAVWKRQELPLGTTANLAELKDTFEARRRKMAATLLARDLLEAGAGVLVAGALAAAWWQIGRAAWPLALAILLMLGLSGFFVRERFRARRARLGPDSPLLDRIATDLAELRHQRQLLLNVTWWYLAPCIAAFLVVGITVIRLAPPAFLRALWENPGTRAWLAGYVLVLLPALFWCVWWINRRTAQRQIEPRIAELEKLQRELLDPVQPEFPSS